MEEEEERRQQTAMEVRMKKEKSEEILKERENVVRKVFMPAYGQLLVKWLLYSTHTGQRDGTGECQGTRTD